MIIPCFTRGSNDPTRCVKLSFSHIASPFSFLMSLSSLFQEPPQSNSTRRAFIKSFLAGLPVHDQKDVLRYLSSMTTLRRDIISSLLIELARRVFSCLDSDFLMSVRTVSQRWLAILSNESFCGHLCRERFDIHDRAAEQHGSSATWNEVFLKQASKRHALAHGRPWAKASYYDYLSPRIEYLTYYSGKMAWVKANKVFLLDLKTDEIQHYEVGSRAKILDLRLSEDWLVMLIGR